jgi:hypothetical protein
MQLVLYVWAFKQLDGAITGREISMERQAPSVLLSTFLCDVYVILSQNYYL